jgi:hypothetical protein
LKNDDQIPEELKDALFVLSDEKKDIRKLLLMANIMIRLDSKIGIEDICRKIDYHILKIYNDPKRKEMQKYKYYIGYILNEFLEKDPKAKDHFVKCYDKKDSIVMQIVWDKKTRELMTKVNKYPEGEILEFLENKDSIQILKAEKNNLLQEIASLKQEKKMSKILTNF